MSFAKYLMREILSTALLGLLVVITLPLWLPFWLWTEARSWLSLQRFYWQCEQRRTDGVAVGGEPSNKDVTR